MDEQIRRIQQMEEILQGAKPALEKLEEALDAFAALREPLAVLDAYYGSKEWLRDLDDDAASRSRDNLEGGKQPWPSISSRPSRTRPAKCFQNSWKR